VEKPQPEFQYSYTVVLPAWRVIVLTIFGGSLLMGPSNDHELAITIAVDKISAEGRLSLSSIPEVTGSLHFLMSRSDSEFLVKYIRWRMDNPIAK
jgi:hypothetical protein